jgi:hypothetical protein
MLERISYRGWENAYRIANATIELVVLADVGPRVVSCRLVDGGENIFHEIPEQAGLTGGNDFRLYGGHRLWVWPEVERTYFPDNSSLAVSQSHNQVSFKAEVESAAPGSNLQKELEIRLEEGSRATVTHRVTNRDGRPTELAVWAPTMMKAGGRAIVPLPPRAAMDRDHFHSVGPLTLWSFTDFADSRWVLGTEYVQLQQQTNPTGRFPEQMIGVYNPAGWGAYFLNGTVFFKTAPLAPGALYPDFAAILRYSPVPIFSNLRALARRFSWVREKTRVTRKAGRCLRTSPVARTTLGFVAPYCRWLLTCESCAVSR